MIVAFILVFISAYLFGLWFPTVFTDADKLDWLFYAFVFLLGMDMAISRPRGKPDFHTVKYSIITILASILGSGAAGLLCAVIFKIDMMFALGVTFGFGWFNVSSVTAHHFAGPQATIYAFVVHIMRLIIGFVFMVYLPRQGMKSASISAVGVNSKKWYYKIMSRILKEKYAQVLEIHGQALMIIAILATPLFFMLAGQ